MPEQEEGTMEGFQLWLNLPGKDKMREPWYRDIPSGEIPEFTTAEGVLVRVIAGHSHGVSGAVQREHTQPLYLDLHFPLGRASFSQALPALHNAFVYVYRGKLEVVDQLGEPTTVPVHSMALLANEGDGVTLRPAPKSAEPARALLIAGKPLREPIAQYGPFVMNTREQVIQAVEDFQNGRLA
jgi:redox-sensitive bicupin YhaK (pirin superfamily)